MKFSLTIGSLVALIIGIFLDKSGMEVAPEKIQTFIEISLQIIGAIGVYWGRYRKGDLNIFGGRKYQS